MYEKLGKYVKMRRLEMGLSLREFGKLCDMSHTHIDSIEKGVDMRTGRSVNLTATSIAKLANALGVSESALLSAGGDEKPTPASDAQLKLALFGDTAVPDSTLDEVKKYAEFIKNRS